MQLAPWLTRFVMLAAALSTASCAAINTGVDPMAREAGIRGGARMILYGSKSTIDNLKVYDNGSSEPLKIVMVNNPTFGQAMRNSMAQSAAQAEANRVGSATYTTNERYSPAVFLKTKGSHQLHLVASDGREVTIDRKGYVAKKYLIIDWLLFAPTLGTSILIDWTTGKWKEYGNIMVDSYFPPSGAPSGN